MYLRVVIKKFTIFSLILLWKCVSPKKLSLKKWPSSESYIPKNLTSNVGISRFLAKFHLTTINFNLKLQTCFNSVPTTDLVRP